MRTAPLKRPAALALLAAVLPLVAGAGTARAHQLLVLDPGSAQLDVGTGEPARLVHASLLRAGDELRVTIAPRTDASEAVLYLPDHGPEREFDAKARPRLLTVPAVPGGASEDGEIAVDEATGIAYREIARTAIPARRTPVTLVVRRGAEPVRVALRVGTPTTFAADDIDRTPRAATRARIWAETVVDGSSGRDTRSDRASRHRVAWYGAAITLIALAVAAWWVLRGWSAARRRGEERARGERDG